MRAVTIDSDLATLFTFTPRKPPITPIQGVLAQLRICHELVGHVLLSVFAPPYLQIQANK